MFTRKRTAYLLFLAAYIGALDDPKRDAYQKPHEVLTALNIKPGEVIADIGAGSG